MIVENFASVILVFYAVCITIPLGDSKKLPSFIRSCHSSDPDLSRCLRDTAQKALQYMDQGLPDLGIPGIDPLHVSDVMVDQPALKIQFKNPTIHGLKSCIINELKINTVKRQILLNYTKNGSFTGKYKIDGQLIFLPIRGEGDSKIVFTNLNYVFKIHYDIYQGSDGKEHWKIVKHKVKYSPKKVQFFFANLFNGNKQLADTAHRVVNDNWGIIFTDLSPPIMVQVTKSIINVIEKFFEAIPAEELFVQ